MVCRALVVSVVVALIAPAAIAGDPQAFTVPGNANIFGAGHGVAPGPDGGGGGALPTLIPVPGGLDPGAWVEFPVITGVVSCCNSLDFAGNGPDGGPFASGNTDIVSWAGVSGIVHSSRTMFLVGVFINDSEPDGDAPFRLVYDNTNDGLPDYSPELNQSFFIGDGHTSAVAEAGADLTTQRFYVPAGATRLFLGFADAFEFGNPSNPPGFYDDNVGELNGRAVFLPAPGIGLFIGAGGMVLVRRRR